MCPKPRTWFPKFQLIFNLLVFATVQVSMPVNYLGHVEEVKVQTEYQVYYKHTFNRWKLLLYSNHITHIVKHFEHHTFS